MSVSAVTAATASTTSTADTTSRLPIQTLGQEDFLKLLVAQLTTQDPLKPQTDAEFIAQMAQFSTLEQSKSMQQDIALLREQQSVAQAGNLIGKQVSLLDGDGIFTQGLVSAIQLDGSSPKLIVGDQAFDLSQVIQMSEPTAEPTT